MLSVCVPCTKLDSVYYIIIFVSATNFSRWLPRLCHSAEVDLQFRSGVRCNIKQASHWHDSGFTPWHAVWRADDEELVTVCVEMRGGAGQVK